MATLQDFLTGLRSGGAISAPQAPARTIPGAAPVQGTPTGAITAPAPQRRQIPGPAPAQPTSGGAVSAPQAPARTIPGAAPVQTTAAPQGKFSQALQQLRELPPQAADPAQINIGDIIRRLMNIQPRSYRNLLPSDRARFASGFSQLGVPPEDAFASIERQFPQGVNPASISFGAGF